MVQIWELCYWKIRKSLGITQEEIVLTTFFALINFGKKLDLILLKDSSNLNFENLNFTYNTVNASIYYSL